VEFSHSILDHSSHHVRQLMSSQIDSLLKFE